jgi:hypothetical protein
MALRSLPFFSHFVLCTGKLIPFPESGINFPCIYKMTEKMANFAVLYYPHFTTFHNETMEYY